MCSLMQHKPEPHKPLKMQDKAAFKERLLDHNASLDVDSPMSPIALSTIICTITEKNSDPELIGEMISFGMKVARFDMNYTTASDQAILIKKFRSGVLEYSKKIRKVCTVAIAIELKGTVISIGAFHNNVEKLNLKAGEVIMLSASRAYDDCGTNERIYVDYDELPSILQPKDKLYLHYGRIELQVRGVVDNDIVCEIVTGGNLPPHTELTVLGVPLNLSAITEKDVEDLNFALDAEVDAIIIPMVRTGSSVDEVRDILGKRRYPMQIIFIFRNLEVHSSLALESIKGACNFFIPFRLCHVELSTEKVMQAQKSMVARANKAGKPVYAVTEYLNSMIHENCPTFAEATDVINAVIEGVDGLILEEETAIGDHPGVVVQTLSQLCREAESQIWQSDIYSTLTNAAAPPVDPAHAICMAAVESSLKAHASGIIVVTTSGKSAILIARYRPRCPVFAVTRYGAVARKMNLYKSVLPVHVLSPPHPCWSKDVDLRMQEGIDYGKAINIIKPGDALILVNSWRPGAGFTNNIRIVYAS
uniref:Pyruvate kinase n=1 Tax=Rhodnius prolixus TaxID=13249 RepID=T1I3S6_RHOPR